MTDAKSSYRQIIKSTSIFGSVQVFTIIISLIKSKVIAIVIGPAGIGLIGLFNTTINLVGSFTNAGLETSGVKAISTVSHDSTLLAREVSIVNRLVWISGFLGLITLMIFSPLLSQFTFGNTDHTLSFVLLSATLLFKQLTSGSIVVLQGLSKLKYLAKANIYGNLFGLLIAVPLYYFFGIDGIIPSIVLSSLLAMTIAFLYKQKVKIATVKLTNKEVFTEGKQLILLGFSLSIIGLLTTLSSYLLQVFISNYSTVTEVGFYTAGFTILNAYVGVIFTAMATDYYPRLAKVCTDTILVRKLVKEQSEIGVLLLTPIIVLFLAFAPNVIRILYSEEFLPIVPLVCWGILGMIIKAVSWSMGYILIAKGDSKIFVKTSIGFNSVFLIINVLGYCYFGLEGLGITFLMNYIIHFLVLKIIVSKRYDFAFDNEFYKLFGYCSGICIITFLCLSIDFVLLKYILLSILILISLCFSWIQLNRRLHFKDFISRNNK
ncbi:O-antigen translocase [Flavobacterium sp. 25HG05S-40]|uniref:O-antigen translocase n=1 Tax=Flavobacterium sp. 25HG05S-40 TaxID=3458682 RepID=UPI004043A5C5